MPVWAGLPLISSTWARACAGSRTGLCQTATSSATRGAWKLAGTFAPPEVTALRTPHTPPDWTTRATGTIRERQGSVVSASGNGGANTWADGMECFSRGIKHTVNTWSELLSVLPTPDCCGTAISSEVILAASFETKGTIFLAASTTLTLSGSPAKLTTVLTAGSESVINSKGKTIDQRYQMFNVDGGALHLNNLVLDGVTNTDIKLASWARKAVSSASFDWDPADARAMLAHSGATVTAANVEFKHFHAAHYGAVKVDGSTATFDSCTFYGNTAQAYIGAIGAVGSSLLTIKDTTIDYAVGWQRKGGAAVHVQDSMFTMSGTHIKNVLGREGGAVRIINSTGSVSDSSVEDVRVGFIANSKGGGFSLVRSTVDMVDVTIARAQADAFSSNGWTAYGGGISVDDASTLNVHGAGLNLANNTATTAGQDLYVCSESKVTGAGDWATAADVHVCSNSVSEPSPSDTYSSALATNGCVSGYYFTTGNNNDATCTVCADGKFKTGTTTAQSCEDKKTEDDCSTSQYFTAGVDADKAEDDSTCTPCADGEHKTSKTACSPKRTRCPHSEYFTAGTHEERTRDDTTCTRPGGLSIYTFTIAEPHSHSSRSAINNIEFVGAQLSTVQMVPAKDGDYCVRAGTQLSTMAGVRCPLANLYLAGKGWPSARRMCVQARPSPRKLAQGVEFKTPPPPRAVFAGNAETVLRNGRRQQQRDIMQSADHDVEGQNVV